MSGDVTKGTVFKHVSELLSKLRREYNAPFHVALYTSFGKIVCDIEPLSKEDSLLAFTDDPTAFTVDASAIFSEKSEFSEFLINAKNVIVYSGAEEELMRAEQMLLFSDRILGFSLVRK